MSRKLVNVFVLLTFPIGSTARGGPWLVHFVSKLSLAVLIPSFSNLFVYFHCCHVFLSFFPNQACKLCLIGSLYTKLFWRKIQQLVPRWNTYNNNFNMFIVFITQREPSYNLYLRIDEHKLSTLCVYCLMLLCYICFKSQHRCLPTCFSWLLG